MPLSPRAALVIAVLAAAGCGDNNPDTPPGPATCLPGCAGVRTFDAVSYDLHAAFDWTAQTMTATEDIALDASASGAIVRLDAGVAVTRVHAAAQELAFHLDPTAKTLDVDLTPLHGASPAMFTVEYTAAPSDALIPTTSTANDPVQSRVVYTDSEPDRAAQWLVTKLDPSDRALWSVDVTVDPDEDVIANGERLSDQTVAGKRVVAYALDKPIPTYLMAFAAGQLEHTDRPGAPVPLSVWYRRGLILDPNVTLDAVQSAMTTFETLVMPYPWARYSVVLLPYGGGMENATITFNNETAGQGPGSFVLEAHELAHHWFGDYVTMHGFDDVWFKEGMATLLESEAERATRDAQGTGRRFGTDFAFSPVDAIVDDSLHGLAKYTSGPYQRAAWTITQIRVTVGETAFWAGLRALLAAHPYGSATGEEFIRSFQPALDEATVQKLLAALPQKALPQLAFAATTAGGATHVTATLSDPSGVMIAPLDLAVIDAAGSGTTTHLAAGGSASLTVPAGGYLGIDERDVHPPWDAIFGLDTQVYDAALAVGTPTPPAPAPVLAAFTSRSAAVQETTSNAGDLPLATPAEVLPYIASLDSDVARESAVIATCERAASTADPAWRTAVEPLFETPPRAHFNGLLTVCGPDYAAAHFETQIAAGLADGSPAALARVEYLLSFDYGNDTNGLIAPIGNTAPTLRLREIAQQRLVQNRPAPSVPLTHLRGLR